MMEMKKTYQARRQGNEGICVRSKEKGKEKEMKRERNEELVYEI